MAYQPSIQSYGNNTGMHYEGGFGGFGGKWVPNTNSAGRVGTSGGMGGFWDTRALPPIQQGTVGATAPAWQTTGGATPLGMNTVAPGSNLVPSPTTPITSRPAGATVGSGYTNNLAPISTQPTTPFPGGTDLNVLNKWGSSQNIPNPSLGRTWGMSMLYGPNYTPTLQDWKTWEQSQWGSGSGTSTTSPTSTQPIAGGPNKSSSIDPYGNVPYSQRGDTDSAHSSTPSGYLTNFQYGSNPFGQSSNTSGQTNPFMDFAMGGNTKFPGLFSSQGSDWSSNIPTSLYSNTIGSYA